MKKSLAKYLLCISISTSPYLVYAEIITDGSMGSATNLTGPNYTISQQLGQLAGDNLFHSFQSFNINSGESATFTGSSSIQNVISRVTGGNISTINGLLNSEIGSQGFYFINPAGVFFGPEASVNVPASFHVSTADEIQFVDGNKYSATNLAGSSISVESPEAFGFGGNKLAKITFDSSRIQLNKGNTLSVVAGEIDVHQITGNTTPSGITSPSSSPIGLSAEEGEIRLIAHGQDFGSVPIFAAPGINHNGNLNITSTRLSVAGNGSGSIILRGGNSALINANFIMDNMGDKAAQGELDIYVQDLLMESKNLVDADAQGAGKGADIIINAKNNISINNSEMDLITVGDGNGGDISINAPNLTFNNGTTIFTSTNAKGNAGNIYLNADNLILDGGISEIGDPVGVLIASQSLSEAKGGTELKITQAEGDGGHIVINAKNIDVLKTATISTSTFAKGNAGTISITTDKLNIDPEGFLGIDSPILTGIFSNANVYESSVIINNPDLPITDPGRIETVEVVLPSTGNAGEITLNINENLNITNGGEISSSTHSEGNAGKIEINAKNILVDEIFNYYWKINSDGDFIPFDKWDVTEGEFILQSQGGLFSSSNGMASGNAGIININTENLTVSNGGNISSTSSTTGKAGSISINASDLVYLNNAGIITIKGQDYQADSNNSDTPSLSINAKEIELDGMSNISSQSGGIAPASNILIDTEDGLSIMGLSQISSEAENSDSGSINISGSSLLLEQGLVTTSVGRLEDDGTPVIVGDGGNLNIASDALIMSNGFIQANTQGVDGRGGAIFIDSDQVITAYNSLEVGGGEPREFVPNSGKNIIQAAAPEGTPGEINITSPIDDVTSTIHAVDSSFKPLIVIVDNPCQVDSGELPSSLIFTGLGVTPQAATDNIMVAPDSISSHGKPNSDKLVLNKPTLKLAKSLCSR